MTIDWIMSHPIAFTVTGYIFFSTVTCVALAQLSHRIDVLRRRLDALDDLSDQIYELVNLRDRIDKLEEYERARTNASTLEEHL